MNILIAYKAIITALTNIDDLGTPDLDPVGAEEHKLSRALFLEISPSYTGGASDVTMTFVGGDPRMTHDMESLARVTAHIHVRQKPGDPHKSLVLLEKIVAVQEAVRTLSGNTTTDFTCHVDDAALDIPKDADWAAARLGIGVGAFQS